MIKNLLSYLEKRKSIDAGTMEEIVRLLVRSDVGPKTSRLLVRDITNSNYKPIEQLKKNIIKILHEANEQFVIPEQESNTILMVGANGAGKTTTTAKLAVYLKKNHQITIVGADVFRAAAREQLIALLEPLGINVFTSFKHNDPSAVVYEAHKKAITNNSNLLIVDTAGRLHTNLNLMAELKKIKDTVIKFSKNRLPIVILVLDGTSGRNGIRQVAEFSKVLEVNGLIVTKLDGSAKAGFILEVAQITKKPIFFICNGEELSDLEPFNPENFAEIFLEGPFK